MCRSPRRSCSLGTHHSPLSGAVRSRRAASGRPRRCTSRGPLQTRRRCNPASGGSATVHEKYTDADDPKRLVEIEQLLTKGNDAFRANRIDEAIDTYRSIIAKRPDTEDAYRKLALAYWRTNREQLAIQTHESAIRNGITQSEVRIKLGQYLAEGGQPAKAIELLKDTAGTDPDALVALGNAY